MPELSPGSEYLVAFLHSAGTATATGMGLTGLSWQELEAWVRCTDQVGIVTARDLRVVHTLSRIYANEYARASQKGATAPYTPPKPLVIEQEIREVISEKAEDFFDDLMTQQER